MVEKKPAPTFQWFEIQGSLPNLNQIIAAAKTHKGKWSKYAKMKQDIAKICERAIVAAALQPMDDKITLHFTWIEKNKRRDKDNITAGQKFIIDALVACKIIQNDGWAFIHHLSHEWKVDKGAPRIRIELRSVEESNEYASS